MLFVCRFLQQKFINVMNKHPLFSRVWELLMTPHDPPPYTHTQDHQMLKDVVLLSFNQYSLLSAGRLILDVLF